MEPTFTRSRQKSLFQADRKELHSAFDAATHCPFRVGGSSAYRLKGLILFKGLLRFCFFLLWYKGMDSVEKEVSNLLCINFTSKSCSQSTLLQRITLAEPFQHLHSWQSADSLFPHQCSKYSWLGKDANISSRSPPWAPKTKNKSKALVNLQKARSMFFFYLEIRFCTV